MLLLIGGAKSNLVLGRQWKTFWMQNFKTCYRIEHSWLHKCVTLIVVDECHQPCNTFGIISLQINSGVSIKFEVGSWLKKNNRLYEQGAVRPINLGGSGGILFQKTLKSEGSEMPFPAFWAPNYHASTSGNYSLCMAI